MRTKQEVIDSLNDSSATLKPLLNIEEVGQYIQTMEHVEQLKDELREIAISENSAIDYDDPVTGERNSCILVVKTKYTPDINIVKKKFGTKYIKEDVDIASMKKDPDCTEYLESVSTQKIETQIRKKAVKDTDDSFSDLF